jgi:hypothetical protein
MKPRLKAGSKEKEIQVTLKLRLPERYWKAFVELAKAVPSVDENGKPCRTPDRFLAAFVKENVKQTAYELYPYDAMLQKIGQRYNIERRN